MSGRVLQFTPRFCAACKDGLHSRCWAWLDEVFGAQGRPCPCDCRDERGDLTRHALIDMATRQPDVLARWIKVQSAFVDSSLDLHLRLPEWRVRR
jgi:hypothetical protein